MPARLQITPSVGEPFELIIGNTATIGRTSDNTICLHGSPLVSRHTRFFGVTTDIVINSSISGVATAPSSMTSAW